MRIDAASVIWIVTGALILLKASGMTSISWWWVTIAIWLPFAITIGILAIGIALCIIAIIGCIVFIGILEISDNISEYKRRKKR